MYPDCRNIAPVASLKSYGPEPANRCLFLVAGIAKEFCDYCAKVCEDCAEECDEHGMDHCKQCAKVCRDCSKICKEMVAK
jgi:hypothetical protein